ncbi:hypothetical protein PtrSN001C_009463, partial [Pyrenophora tritici-repentis]
RSACKRALRAQLIRLGQNVQAERAERAGSLVDKLTGSKSALYDHGLATSDNISWSQ